MDEKTKETFKQEQYDAIKRGAMAHECMSISEIQREFCIGFRVLIREEKKA
ncbi:MAG: hypothetical protein HUJ60_01020 [Bacilli bacterium]|nr:hypothetical protein [Bacilli bacterium]